MNKGILKGMGVCLLGLILSCLLSLLTAPLFVRIVDMFITTEGFVEVLVMALVSLLTVCATFGVVAYLVAYHMASFDVGGSALRLGVALLIQLAVALLLKFEPFVAGGVKYLAAIFEFGVSIGADSKAEMIGLIDYLLAFVIFSAIYMASYLGFGILGRKKRMADREELFSDTKE